MSIFWGGIGSITCKVSMIKIWCKLLKKYACLKHSKPYCGQFCFVSKILFLYKMCILFELKMVLTNLMNKGAKWVEIYVCKTFWHFSFNFEVESLKVYEPWQKAILNLVLDVNSMNKKMLNIMKYDTLNHHNLGSSILSTLCSHAWWNKIIQTNLYE